MEHDDRRQNREDDGNDPIEERLIDGGGEGQQEIVEAATEAFNRDQKDPDHPTRIKRQHDVEDPSHSVGSTRQGAGAQDIDG